MEEASICPHQSGIHRSRAGDGSISWPIQAGIKHDRDPILFAVSKDYRVVSTGGLISQAHTNNSCLCSSDRVSGSSGFLLTSPRPTPITFPASTFLDSAIPPPMQKPQVWSTQTYFAAHEYNQRSTVLSNDTKSAAKVYFGIKWEVVLPRLGLSKTASLLMSTDQDKTIPFEITGWFTQSHGRLTAQSLRLPVRSA